MSSTETADRDQIRRFQDRLRVVSEAARTFAEATTDYARLLDGVARTLSDVLKDACSVFLLTDDGRGVQAVALHANEAWALEQIRHMFLGAPLVLAEQPALRNVLETGRSFLVPRVDPIGPREDTTPGQVTWQRKLGLHSFLVVALRAHGRAMGVLTLGRFRPGAPPFDEDDRELAESLAVHASLAIENAQLYVAAQDARRLAERAEEVIRKDHAERLRAQAALDESEGRLRRTLDSMLEGYTILGRDLRYLYVNEPAPGRPVSRRRSCSVARPWSSSPTSRARACTRSCGGACRRTLPSTPRRS
jgi:GAF domain-containing protein